MALLKHTLVHITATVSQVSVYSLADMSPAMAVCVGHVLTPSLSVPPRRKNVHGALANVHECSSSLLSPSFIEQVARRFVEFVEFEYYCARASEIR